MNSTRVRRRGIAGRRRTLVAFVLAATMLVAACSGGSGSDTSTTSTTTTTTPPPSTTEAEAAPEEPPQVEWIVQVGGPDNDALLGVAAREDEVVSAGYTEGSLQGEGSGGRDVLTAVVGTDAEIRSLRQTGEGGDDSAFGIGAAGGTTITCGYTESDLGGVNAGSADAWCAPVDPTGSLGNIHQQGGTDWDRLYGTAVAPEGTFGYTGGYTLGLFPGASNTSAGLLGDGDAIIWQVNADGTPRWIRQFGTAATDWGQGVATTQDGDGLLVGYTQGDLDGPSNGGTDGFIARFDRDGLPRFIRQFGSDGADWPKGVASGGEPTQGNETFVTVGSTDGALAPALGGALVDPTDAPRADGAEPAPSNAGGTDAMVVAVDPAGETRWTAQLGSDMNDDAIGVAVDGTTVLVAGTTSGVLDTTGQPAAGGRDGFLAALDLETGSLRWITQFGSAADEDVYGMTVTEDGLVVISGQTTGDLGDNTNAGGSDGFLIAFPLPTAGGSVASAL
ncbi:MAG: hypothetical protein H6517_04690 [Microthrixaceae bacterium]|nr:hypothetical protein [Microthrixaceae bacterium]